jgi:hypothetical protein
MKFGTLTAIGHNIADSVACGMGFMLGAYQMDVFGEAGRTPEGFIEVDFLTGETSGGQPSASLALGLQLYADKALPQLCESHGGTVSEFRKLNVRFWPGPLYGRFEVRVEDQKGHSSTAEYEGLPGKRVKVLDHLGRVRPK